MGFFLDKSGWSGEWVGAWQSIHNHMNELEAIKVISGCEKKSFGTFQFHHLTTFHLQIDFVHPLPKIVLFFTTILLHENERPQKYLNLGVSIIWLLFLVMGQSKRFITQNKLKCTLGAPHLPTNN
jgi:hypothetical protein